MGIETYIVHTVYPRRPYTEPNELVTFEEIQSLDALEGIRPGTPVIHGRLRPGAPISIHGMRGAFSGGVLALLEDFTWAIVPEKAIS